MGFKYSSEVTFGAVGAAVAGGIIGLLGGIAIGKAATAESGSSRVTSTRKFNIDSRKGMSQVNWNALAETY